MTLLPTVVSTNNDFDYYVASVDSIDAGERYSIWELKRYDLLGDKIRVDYAQLDNKPQLGRLRTVLPQSTANPIPVGADYMEGDVVMVEGRGFYELARGSGGNTSTLDLMGWVPQLTLPMLPTGGWAVSPCRITHSLLHRRLGRDLRWFPPPVPS